MIAIVIVITIVCILLILVILAQNSKGGGLSSQFGGSSTSQLIGVKKTGDFLEKFTWALAITLLILTLSTDFLISNDTNEGVIDSPNINRAQDRIVTPQDNQLNLENAPENTTITPVDEGETEEENDQ